MDSMTTKMSLTKYFASLRDVRRSSAILTENIGLHTPESVA